MSAMGNGDTMNTSDLGTFGSGSGKKLSGVFTDSGNLYNVGNGTDLSGLGTSNIDPNGNLLNVGMEGTGPGAGWQNGNLSFMPDNSMSQMASNALGALSAGGKIPMPQSSQGQMGSPGSKLRLSKSQFASPVAQVGGTAPSSSDVSALIALLKKYAPGVQS